MNVDIKNITKYYDKKLILKDIDISIKSGEIVCLLGPSGCGKTTLIRLILGAIKSNTGEIDINGVKVPDLNLLKSIGYMPQNDALYEDLTAEQNMRFFAGLYKDNVKDFKKRSTELLEIVNLVSDSKKLISKFSGGMKKRLSLAISMYNNPDILLLDEPTVGIDPVLRRNIWIHLKKLKEEGKTIIVTTHVMDEIKECDKAALIYNTKLIEFDTVDNLLSKTNDGKIEELFLSSDVLEGDKL